MSGSQEIAPKEVLNSLFSGQEPWSGAQALEVFRV